MFSLSNPEIRFAIEAVREAIPLAKQIQKEMAGQSLTKSDESPVTVADFSIQALIAHRLSQAFPHDPLLAEESSRILKKEPATLQKVTAYVKRVLPQATPQKICGWIDHSGRGPGLARGLWSSTGPRLQAAGRWPSAARSLDSASGSTDRFWTLDPIDGTKGFLKGAQYVVALALIQKGQVQLGVLGCPHLKDGCRPDLNGEGSLVLAAKGQGAWTTSASKDAQKFQPLKVANHQDSKEAVLLGSVDPTHTDKTKLHTLLQALGVKPSTMRRMDSQAKYAVLAGGLGDFFLYFLPEKNPGYRMKIWDVAPGAIIVKEAGGKVSDLLGNSMDFTCGKTLSQNPGLLVTNGYLHPLILQEVKKIL